MNPNEIGIRLAQPGDCGQLSRLREALWPDSSAKEHGAELVEILAGSAPGLLPMAVFAAETVTGLIIGFLEVGLRSHADCCDASQPVGFVEGLFVLEPYRRKRVGAQLMAAAEDWARSQGCKEMASDTELENVVSQRTHEALGYEVVSRAVNFRKAL